MYVCTVCLIGLYACMTDFEGVSSNSCGSMLHKCRAAVFCTVETFSSVSGMFKFYSILEINHE